MALNRLLATTILAAGLVATPFLATQAEAQDMTPDAPAAGPGAELAADEAMVDAFITAALAVAETREQYMAQLEATTDEEEQMAIVQEADAAILQVVEESPDITVDEYIAIGEAASQDPDLAAEIDARFAEAHGG
ncbi:MAG: DUF4168 domain-containing protein [Rhodobacteraceae bacterium]|nr:DUF4168 domain-containing protein [Paracoccaceae bacterium]TVR48203.1 MAG: DUF4168 domain-containing protein [Paracoccaceae bacterium]